MQVVWMDQMQLKTEHSIKFSLSPGAQQPAKAHPDDAGWDLFAKDDGEFVYDSAGELLSIRYDTGVRCDPCGAAFMLFPRSSVAKTDLIMANSIGLIDSGYRGNIIAVFKPTRGHGWPQGINRYKKGDRIAQLVPFMPMRAEFVMSDDLSETGRGTGGFGSTGS